MRVRVICAGIVVVVSATAIAAQPPASSTRSASSAAAGVTVSGSVYVKYAETSTEIPQTVTAVPTPDATRRGVPGPTVQVGPNGRFEFKDMAPGPYRLMLDRGEDSLHPVVVEVGNTNVTDVRLGRVPRIPVTVTCVAEAGATLPATLVFQVHAGQDWALYVGFDPKAEKATSIPPGTYPITIGAPAGYYVRSVRAGARDLLREPLTIEPASGPVTVTVVVGRGASPPPGTAHVSGLISGSPDGTEVELVDARAQTIAGRTMTGPGGAFQFAGLRSGVYELNLPPARHVVTGIVVLGQDVVLDVPVARGSLFSGNSVMVVNEAGQPGPYWPGRISLVAEAGDVQVAFPVRVQGFWGALPPGSYHLRIDGLPDDFSVKSLSAGSVDLLQRPFSVPTGRPAETITLVLQLTSGHRARP